MSFKMYIRDLSDEYLIKALNECRGYMITKMLLDDGNIKELCKKYNEICHEDAPLEVIMNDVYFELSLRYHTLKMGNLNFYHEKWDELKQKLECAELELSNKMNANDCSESERKSLEEKLSGLRIAQGYMCELVGV